MHKNTQFMLNDDEKWRNVELFPLTDNFIKNATINLIELCIEGKF